MHLTQLLDTPAEGRFDRITRIARRLLSTPMAGISLIDGERCWFKSLAGVVGLVETPTRNSLCAEALKYDDVVVVRDALAEAEFAVGSMVRERPFVRFFAGKSLCFQGDKVGVLSVMDTEPREFGLEERRDLTELALWAEAELESGHLSEAQVHLISEVRRLKREALVDSLTGAWNRAGIEQIFIRERAQAMRDGTSIGVVMADVDHFKQVNDTHGHSLGDYVLRSVSERIRLATRPYDSVGRVGGEEFLLILPNTDLAGAAQVADRIRLAVSLPDDIPGVGPLTVTLSQGVVAAHCRGDYAPELDSLRTLADEALYRAKHQGRDRVELSQQFS